MSSGSLTRRRSGRPDGLLEHGLTQRVCYAVLPRGFDSHRGVPSPASFRPRPRGLEQATAANALSCRCPRGTRDRAAGGASSARQRGHRSGSVDRIYDNRVDLFQLARPEHLAQPAWDSIELARGRLQRAWDFDDLPDVVGKAKELVETVAKVTVEAAEGAVADSVDFQPIVKAAQKVLGRQPGLDLSQDQHLRAMAQAAQTIATSLAPIRNVYGTGHGRARVPDVVVEMATLSLESALMWSRWALRRLGHLLAEYPNELIAAVQTGTSRRVLREKFEAAALAQQPSEVQHRIGVAFGQQSAGGFGNATEVGVEPAVEGGYDEYPIDYRRGLLEGMLLTGGGSIGLTDFYAPWFVSLLSSLPEREVQSALECLRDSVIGAPWIGKWRGATKVKPADVVSALQSEGERLPSGYGEAFQALCSELLHAGESAELEDKD